VLFLCLKRRTRNCKSKMGTPLVLMIAERMLEQETLLEQISGHLLYCDSRLVFEAKDSVFVYRFERCRAELLTECSSTQQIQISKLVVSRLFYQQQQHHHHHHDKDDDDGINKGYRAIAFYCYYNIDYLKRVISIDIQTNRKRQKRVVREERKRLGLMGRKGKSSFQYKREREQIEDSITPIFVKRPKSK